MPKASVWLVRGALLNFAFGVSLGMLLMVARAVNLPSALWRLRQLHVEILLLGFMVQLTFGVAYWILPRRGIAPSAVHLVSAAVLLNAGVWLTGMGAGFQHGTVELAGRLTEATAMATFASGMWPRVQALRRAP